MAGTRSRPLGAIGVAAVYAAKARILFLRRARAEPLAYLPRQRRNKRVRDRRRQAETLLRLRSREPGGAAGRPDQHRIIHPAGARGRGTTRSPLPAHGIAEHPCQAL